VTVIPAIDVGPLFGPPSQAREAVDRQLIATAGESGFMTIVGFPADIDTSASARSALLQLFSASRAEQNALASNKTDPSRPLVYRGWFGVMADRASHYDGIEIGPDILHGEVVLDPDDPLRGPTPMPLEAVLPGWRNAVRDYFRGMERVSDALMRALARGLGLPEQSFAAAFDDGISTLRLLRYPVRARSALPDRDIYVEHGGRRREIVGEPHADFGFLTLLVQDRVGGLQARMPGGSWIDIPPVEGQIVVNFGKLLERWTGERIRATEHRVLSSGQERFSLPFFYEPRVDARIAPLPNAEPFTPFLYGDHVWSSRPRLRRLFGERRSGADETIPPPRD